MAKGTVPFSQRREKGTAPFAGAHTRPFPRPLPAPSVEATIVGNVIKGYLNGVEVITATDKTYAAGNPGMGFNYGVGQTNADFGFSSYEVESYND